MRKNSNGFVGSVIMTVLAVAFMFLLTGATLTEYFGGLTEPFATGLILFCALIYLAIAVGVIVALYQRWKEIRGGEEDEAKKY